MHAAVRACMLGLVLSLVPPVARGAPPAGSAIDNIAVGSGADALSGTPQNTISNRVRSLVQVLEGVTLRPDQRVLAPPGAAGNTTHVLTNTGNDAASFRLDITELGGDDFDLLAHACARDINNNGLLDPADPVLAPGGTVLLAAGDSVTLFVRGTLPAPLASGARALVELRATSLLQAVSAACRDTFEAQVSPIAPVLAFYTDGGYGTIAFQVPVTGPLFFEAAAPACNNDPAVRDTISVRITTTPGGDDDMFVATETGPNTARFRVEPFVPGYDLSLGLAASRAGVVEMLRNDLVVGVLGGRGVSPAQARAYADPAGVVFDARSNAAQAGVAVSLIDVTGAGNGGAPNAPARVYLADGVTPSPSTVVSDAAGRIAFPRVRPSTYRVTLIPPGGYRFPSGVAAAALPAGHTIDGAGSYGADFVVAGADAPIVWDQPLDALPQVALYVAKQATRSYAELGDQLDYTVSVESRSDSVLAAVTLNDQLPVGFRYVPGSALLDGAPLADPAGGAGPQLAFALGAFGANRTATVRYRVEIGPGSLDGDGINRAYASADTVQSNVASAQVQLTQGVFADEGMVMGTVFVDRNADGRRDPGEPGMPGVRLWVDDGTFVITDGEGRFSLYGLEPRTLALKVDRTTLPRGVTLVSTSRRDQGTPGLRALDLQRGDLQRADFAIAGDSMAVNAALARAQAGRFGSELTRAGTQLQLGLDPAAQGDARARPVSGVVGGDTHLLVFGAGAPTGAAAPAPGAAAGPAAAGDSATAPGAVYASSAIGARGPSLLETLAPTLDYGLGFVGIVDGDTVPASQIAVRVKGAIGPGFELRVNDEVVPESRVGRRVTSPDRGVEAWEYVGVALRPGVNTLELAQPRPGDIEVPSQLVRVVAPDRLARLELVAPRNAPADGHSLVSVRVRALDANGIPVAGRMLVTLESTLGQWQATDLDPDAPGVQVAFENGETAIGLRAPADPGVTTLFASVGDASVSAALAFTPELRPLIMLGTLEGVVSLKDLTRGVNGAPNPRTGFESGFDQFVSTRHDGTLSAGARGSLFVKGRVAEDMLLTLGYSTDKPDNLRRFRDIQPDEFYPLYGDASVRGYEAQSTGRLYARVDRRGASLLYGDFVSTTGGGARSLANYSRSFTGAQQHYEDTRVRFDAFTSRQRSSRQVDELPGSGISGPYVVTVTPMIENSERIEIVTRDRNQSAVVLRSAPRSRFTDYEINPLTGGITFKSPVPMMDADMNPVYVRVTYDAIGAGDPFWVSGVDGRMKLNRRLELGGTYVDDHDPSGPRELRGLSLAARLGDATTVETEWAGTRTLNGPQGQGGRLELRTESPRVQSRVWGSVTDSTFDNPSAGFGPGRIEAGGRFTQRLDSGAQVRAEALYTSDIEGNRRNGGALASIEHPITDHVRAELGTRIAGETARTGDVNPTSYVARGKLQAQLPDHPEVSGFAELEQSVTDSRRMAALGGEYRFNARGRLYARHELISSLTGPYALSNNQRRMATVLGVDANLGRDAHVFNEYRLGNALSAREAEAALGLRNAWTVAPGVRVGMSFERVSPLLGSDVGPQTAITGSVEHVLGDDWTGSGRFELRTSRASDSYLSTLAGGWRLDRAWTALARNLLTVSDDHAAGGRTRERLQMGLAYREPVREDWDALGRYELHVDRDAPQNGVFSRRLAHVLSLHANGRVFDRFVASGAWAAKRVEDRAAGVISSARMSWVHGRFTWELADGWDAGIHGSTLFDAGGASRRDGAGVELGRQMGGGVWLSAGWNQFGFTDDDLTGEEYTEVGGYLRLRARFDESLFQGLPGSRP